MLLSDLMYNVDWEINFLLLLHLTQYQKKKKIKDEFSDVQKNLCSPLMISWMRTENKMILTTGVNLLPKHHCEKFHVGIFVLIQLISKKSYVFSVKRVWFMYITNNINQDYSV